jgi:hypothetical protein
LGRPDRVERSEAPAKDRTLIYEHRRLTVLIDSHRVIEISTTGRRERTWKGVGVGTSYAQLRARLRGEKCLFDHSGRRRVRGRCQVLTDKTKNPAEITTFLFVHGRVTEVTVSSQPGFRI